LLEPLDDPRAEKREPGISAMILEERRKWNLETWLKKYRIFSRLTVIYAMYLLYQVSAWGMTFAALSLKSGVEIAAILAAVQVPATYFAGWAFKIHSENKVL